MYAVYILVYKTLLILRMQFAFKWKSYHKILFPYVTSNFFLTHSVNCFRLG